MTGYQRVAAEVWSDQLAHLLTIGVLLLLSGASVGAIPEYDVPPAELKVLSPRGFEVSIPAEVGISLFAFHGQLNNEFDGHEAGTYARDILKVRNGRFTFRDQQTKLKNGDVLHFWTYVIWNGLGYHQEDGKFIISGLSDDNAAGSQSARPTQPSAISNTPSWTFVQPTTTNRACLPSMTSVGGSAATVTAPCAGDLIFEDAFDRFDANKWRVEQRFSNGPDYEFGIYMDRPDTVSVNDNHLSLGVVRLANDFQDLNIQFGQNCTGQISTDDCEVPPNLLQLFTPPIGLGQISTVRSFHFRYGRVEIRARLPSHADWVFPQLFLQPLDNAYGTEDYASGQMRVAHRTQSCALRGGVVLDSYEPFRTLGLCSKAGSDRLWTDEYHLFALEWQPDTITVSVDNIEYCRLSPIGALSRERIRGQQAPAVHKWRRDGSASAPFDKPFYLMLGVGVAGLNDFGDNDGFGTPKPWRNDNLRAKNDFWRAIRPLSGDQWPGANGNLLVDYVKVYAL